MPLGQDFLDTAVADGGFHLKLPDGEELRGDTRMLNSDERGVLMLDGCLTTPRPGRFFFSRQTADGVAGRLVGHILFDGEEMGWKVEPSGPGRSPRLERTHRDSIICVNYRMPEAASAAAAAEYAPEAHPLDIPLPAYQTIVPLQSLPRASAVVYLDFDGEKGPFPSWGDFDAAAPGVTNEQVKQVWQMVCEDFQGFELNVTTDRKVFENAEPGSRQHVIITPTNTAAPGFGGVAQVSSFNFTADIPCWAFYSTGKYCAEVISHEVGHTLGLSHDGRNTVPAEDYYLGHGSGETGWAPIMGAAYYENVTQWSKGEYALANRTQDDLAIIVSNNNVYYRDDDIGDDLDDARYLEIADDDSVSNEGIIETRADVDAFRFRTTGGHAMLQLDPVALNPNLDILAELEDSNGDLIASANPQETLSATIEVELPAGEYALKVSGTGCGNPFLDGYSDYASLGTYFVHGSVEGGEKPARFAISEHSSEGSAVGSVAPRNDHGTAALTWSIVSGNSSGAFVIDSETGLLTVAESAELDFATLSTRWDVPATFELRVSIKDADTPGLNEVVRVVITLADVNDPPVVPPVSSIVLERTRPGTALLTVESTDPDRFDQPVFAITGGNEAGWFSIDPQSGVISASETGVGEVEDTTEVVLEVQVSDQGSPPLTTISQATLTVIGIPAGQVPGGIVRTYYEGISGNSVSSLLADSSKWPDLPDSEEFLTSFDAGQHGDNFGSSLHGFFIPPFSGNYRFWIASDGSSQLFLNAPPHGSGASPIASVSGATAPRDWVDNAPYRSSPVSLIAGQPCRIEVLHKESTGTDHVSVAFSGPGIPKQMLTGKYLAPEYLNYPPKVAPVQFTISEDAFAGQEVGSVTVVDANSDDSYEGYTILSGNEDGLFNIDAESGKISIAVRGLLDAQAQPHRTLVVGVTDNGSPPRSGSGEIAVTVTPAGVVSGSGIRQQIWDGIEGSHLDDLTESSKYPFLPDRIRTLTSFDSGANIADYYGSRIRALVTPPVSGYYTFYLASNDQAELKLGADEEASSAATVASVSGWTYYNQWTKYSTQQSIPVYLETGSSYYIEALHKEDMGSDHLQVAWTGPGIYTPTVIPGTSLQAFDINLTPVFTPPATEWAVTKGLSQAGAVVGTLAAVDPEGEPVIHAILSGNDDGAFAIDAASGMVTLANPAVLVLGTRTLGIGAQDRGLAGSYPFKTSLIEVPVTVLSNNHPPAFDADHLVGDAAEDLPYALHLTASDPDVDDVLVYSKVSGPEWLSVGEDGTVQGVPSANDIGLNVFTVRVTDAEGAHDEAELSITVTNTNDAPVFSVDPVYSGLLREGEALSASPLVAIDEDAGDTLVYSKTAGPAWLVVAEDGSLSGTPPPGSSGTNVFTVRVTDLAGDFTEASLVIEVLAAVPLPWELGIVGPLEEGWSNSIGHGAFLVSGGGQLAGRNDAFQFVWQPLSGDGVITARVDSMEDTGQQARAGIMIRDSLAANSRHVFIGLAGDGGFRWARRTGLNGNTSTSSSGQAVFPDAWVRLTRQGDQITASKSFDGTTWIVIGSLTAALPETCYFGLAVASGSPGVQNQARFSNVSITP
ncbi:cadherin domain-containing protein [Haloferula sp. BvORR071]|uniref:cadherin domain-containing protein n=1 Tax=Haloferula sp. BvORR071 TaxID=1396141 RepID=UPI0022410187|nr:cadherin domain-containing protein [Haloferula sp. BvORR071]